MRFITEFELDGSSFDNSPAVIKLRKEHGEEKLGALITESFGWDNYGSTTLTGPVKEHFKLEIEAFPMEGWMEFKNKIRELVVSGETDMNKAWIYLLELEYYGTKEEPL